ncbi:CLIP domain-containing serine protease 2-like [Venturia canescens]|uniref:CLIP domain-containing serine protease 2-like n=1 Tax=Venturia canescens TaxID=32260 RepID=UPI001C9CE5B8|nr:CLIP domain-containing serine protease 2-like [Venturia canescens]
MARCALQRGSFALLVLVLIAAVEAQNGNFGTQSNSDCNTPSGLPGRCVAIRQCEPLLNILTTRPLSGESIRFLRESQCGVSTNSRDPKVCCLITEDDSRSTGNEGNGNTNSLDNPNLPADCGSDLSQRIVGGEVTDLTEFPWMVLLEYDKPNGKTTACGGVLITSRYVLTAAHCIKGAGLPKSWSLNAVRLGEYDTSTDRDCVPDGDGSEVCAEPTVTVRIAEAIVHESYRPNARDQQNDVALLRLAENVQFTSYIQPICLPAGSDLAQKLWVAGWGKTETKSESSVKLKLGISPADPSACAERYRNAGVNLGRSQLCAGGQRGKDSCRGDSGGPLMSFDRTPGGSRKWTVVGIVSFGPTPCGMQNWPGVYTKIVDYVPWILSNVRA